MRPWYPFETREVYHTDGVNDAYVVTHNSIARENSRESPYLIPNEWIAGSIGTYLRLPIPPFALVRRDTHKGMFASLRYGRKETPPSDMLPGPCVKNNPRLCTGILLFDILTANGDRHRGNLKVDDKNNPQDFVVIDHERALFGAGIGVTGIARLERKLTELGLSSGSRSGDSPNCFLKTLDTSKHMGEWVEKIASIPSWYVHEICSEMKDGFLTKDEIDYAEYFLIQRRDKLPTIIQENKHKFSSINDWGLLI